jgi:serine/threonine-protein kinase
MEPRDWEQLESIFFGALEVAPDERAAYLDRVCGGDTRLRAEIDAVLVAHGTGTVTERPAPGRSWAAGLRIGPYRIEELLGRGGMGEVYRALRVDDQYHQEVAIKLMRAGFGVDEMTRRFRVERQILANLQHPNIATLLEGGLTDDGLPYLAMQYVRGVPITEYADRHRLRIDQRLALFRIVCDAVQYAHTNLVVHRDLKPSNILVTDDGQVRLLDFGIAKLLDPAEAGVTVANTGDMLLFTPEHAAPEQLQRKTITTATDVYALGVLLYELLTGVRPFQAPTPIELYRAVCDREPTRPSSILSTRSTQTSATVDAPTLAGLRDSRPDGLARQLRGDLDDIVLKALRKEPERRYASAGQFAEDITRYLKGQPVLARPHALGYRITRFIGRNRVAVLLAGMVAASLIAGMLGTAWQARRARQEADQAAAERDRARRVSSLLVDIFKLSDPGSTRGQTVSARDVLAQGSARITNDLAEQPEAQADLLAEVGQIYRNLGLFEEAGAQLERALELRRSLYGERDVRVGETLTQLAHVRKDQARVPEAVRLAQAAAAVLRSQPDAGGTLPLADALLALGEAQRLVTSHASAEASFAQALTLLNKHARPEDVRFAQAYFGLASAAHSQGQFDRADSLLQETVARYARLAGPPHPDAATSLYNLGTLRMYRRKPVEAEPLLRQALAMRRQIYGSVHPAVAETLSALAQVLSLLGRYSDAAQVGTAAVAVSDSAVGTNHPTGAQTRIALGFILLKIDQGERALQVLHDAIATLRARGNSASHIMTAEITIGQAYASMGQWARARVAFAEALRTIEETSGPEHPNRAHLLLELGRLDLDAGQLASAQARAQESIALARKVLRPDHRFVLWSTILLAQVQLAQGKFAPADSLLRSALDVQRRTIGTQHPETAATLVTLADVETRRGQLDSAVAHARTAVSIFEANHERGPALAEARSVLGGALAAQGRRAEAEPMLRNALAELGRMRGARRLQIAAARERLGTADHHPILPE